MNLELLAARPLFSFTYQGEPAAVSPAGAVRCEPGREAVTYTTHFAGPDGLRIIQKAVYYPMFDALEWVLTLRNEGTENTGEIARLYDADLSLPIGEDEPSDDPADPGRLRARIVNPTGSNWTRDEFYPVETFLPEGTVKTWAPSGGRSSFGVAPYFAVSRGEAGCLCAVGWSGQWSASFARCRGEIRMTTGVEDVAFYLYPGEEIRTTSTLLLPYAQGADEAHNRLRRLIKERFSPIGKPGRPAQPPLCFSTWGTVTTAEMTRQIHRMESLDIKPDVYWIDAAWFGSEPYRSEAHWFWQTGDFQVNPFYHPDGLEPVAAAAREAGMGLLLWLEGERANTDSPVAKEHPDWFLPSVNSAPDWFPPRPDLPTPAPAMLLLNLGCREAREYLTELAAGYIERLGLAVYRMDFALDPVEDYWRGNDQPGRRGLNEIRYITGLYDFCDALLERFPHLLLDNCAGGGRRLDMEMMKRAIPLWRSDYQCTPGCDPETAQTHTAGFSRWMPYSGTQGAADFTDTYAMRSAYSPSLVLSAGGFGQPDKLPEDPAALAALRRRMEEYRRLRPYYAADFYPLSGRPALDDGGWEIQQFDRPENRDGILVAFRRPQSPLETARLFLRGVQPERRYRLVSEDTGEMLQFTGQELLETGFAITLTQPRSSAIWRYFWMPGAP